MDVNSILFFMGSISWNPQMQMFYLWNLQNQFHNQTLQKNQIYKLSSFQPLKSEQLENGKQSQNQQNQNQRLNKIIENEKPEEIWNSKDFNLKKQKSERNIRSNTLKYFLKYLESYDANSKRIQRLINYYKIQKYSPQIFIKALREKFLSCKNYIRPNYVKSLIKDRDQNFSKLFRILFRIFAKSEKLISLVHCKKLKIKAKLNHGNTAKKLFKFCIS